MKNTKLKINLILAIIFAFVNCNAQSVSHDVILSSVIFKIKNAKIEVAGNFTTIISKINFDSLNLSKSYFEGKVKSNTIKTGISMRDNHLKKADYFDVDKFPEIIIKSKKITKLSNTKYKATCDLTLKGKTKEVELPFTYNEIGNKGKFSSTLTINRLDFGVGSPSVIMSNNLLVDISITTFSKK